MKINKSTEKNQKTLANFLSSDPKKVETIAYFIWQGKGCPQNSALDDWLEAEKKVNHSLSKSK